MKSKNLGFTWVKKPGKSFFVGLGSVAAKLASEHYMFSEVHLKTLAVREEMSPSQRDSSSEKQQQKYTKKMH